MKHIDNALRRLILSIVGTELYHDAIMQRLLSTGYHVILFANVLAVVIAFILSI